MTPRRRTRPVSSGDSVSSRICISEIQPKLLLSVLVSPVIPVTDGSRGGTMQVWMDSDRASRAAGPRSSLPNSLKSSSASSKKANLGHHNDDLLWDRYGVTYDRAHLARLLRADGMQYAKPRPMDPRQSPDAEADFRERLGEGLTKDVGDDPLVLGFFDASWPQPFENSQRMWSYDRTVKINKPLVTVPWKTIGFYALFGQSTLIFRERTTKESICAELEAIREQNPVE